MRKRGVKPLGQVSTKWSSDLAYAIGLITADGCLSNDGRHIDFTSKDIDLVTTFKRCLGLRVKTGTKLSGIGNIAYRAQFGDVLFYRFLMQTGLMPAKSKELNALAIPREYLLDFTRGFFDGDGCSYSYYDSAFKNSYRFYISFASSSPLFVSWLREELKYVLGIKGHIDYSHKFGHQNLRYAKREAIILSKAMYYQRDLPSLKRKYLKIVKSLRVIGI